MKLRNNSPTVFKSFTHAFNGLKASILTQRNIKIEIFFLSCVLIFGLIFRLTMVEMFIGIFSGLSVIITELINTSIEFLTNLVTKNKWNKEAKIVKDVAAASVLISALFAFIVNFILFFPYVMRLIW